MFELIRDSLSIYGICICVVIVLAICWPKLRPSPIPPQFTSMKSLPTPPGSQLFWGHTPELLSIPPWETMHEWLETVGNSGLIRFTTLMHRQELLLADPDTCMEFLTDKSGVFGAANFIRALLGGSVRANILFSNGADHKTDRKRVAPAFALRRLESLYPVMHTQGLELVRQLHALTSTHTPTTVQLSDYIVRTVLSISGVAGAGTDFNLLQGENKAFYTNYRAMVAAHGLAPNYFPPVCALLGAKLLNWIPVHKFATQSANYVYNFYRRALRDLITDSKHANTAVESIFSVYLSGGLSNEEAVDHATNTLPIATETVTAAIQWTLLMLARYPDTQAKLREELKRHFPDGVRGPSVLTSARVKECAYLQAVVQESLRLYPPVPVIVREALDDTSLAGYWVPKGTLLKLSPYASNRLSTVWGGDAGEFKPERWLGGKMERSAKSFTFLFGGRACLGEEMARGEMACLVLMLVREFEILLEDPGQEVVSEMVLVMKPKGGVRVRLRSLV